jgi:hypothetical protein
VKIDALQQAIINKDADGVVAALARWNEEQRAAAVEPFNLLMVALGLDDAVVAPCSLKPDDRQVQEKRQRDGIRQMLK